MLLRVYVCVLMGEREREREAGNEERDHEVLQHLGSKFLDDLASGHRVHSIASCNSFLCKQECRFSSDEKTVRPRNLWPTDRVWKQQGDLSLIL